MKTIIIETVNGGWIVRPFQPCHTWATGDIPDMHVFTDMEALKAAIPSLLKPEPRQENDPP